MDFLKVKDKLMQSMKPQNLVAQELRMKILQSVRNQNSFRSVNSRLQDDQNSVSSSAKKQFRDVESVKSQQNVNLKQSQFNLNFNTHGCNTPTRDKVVATGERMSLAQ